MQKLFTKGSAAVRRTLLVVADVFCFCLAAAMYLLVNILAGREMNIPATVSFGLVLLVCVISVRLIAGIYSCVWRYANSKVYLTLIVADAMGSFAGTWILRLTDGRSTIYPGFWQCASVCMLACIITLANRMSYQRLYQNSNSAVNDSTRIRVAIVGAGQIGCLLADELMLNPGASYKPVCFVDTDISKIGGRVRELPVYAENEHVIDKLREERVQEIFIALPSVDTERMSALMKLYSKTDCRIKAYGLPADMDGELAAKSGKRILREIKVEDLLFRESLVKRDKSVDAYYHGKTVLVTGGGGSIGSELCRQIVARGPKKIVILDIYENNAYDIQQELLGVYGGDLELCVEIASIRDRNRLETVFATHRPQIVFHAAAHKHVPLMEHSKAEAIKNNVMGTLNTVDTAEKYGVEKFIMISTDKAVNPTNFMGASKRMCEMIVQSRWDSKTVFSCVRFGNVLGSNGSVIPLFKRQIEAGGPVTITDKRIIRYFMTIPEAAQLVMTAGAMAKRGELFVLDMGKPVKILDLAENMIRLSGLEPYKDIDICEIGLRPGEKLYEELLIKNEKLDKTRNRMIFIERDRPHSREEIAAKVEALAEAVYAAEAAKDYSGIKAAMKEAVPTFRDPEEVNAEAEKAEEMKTVAPN